MQGFAEKITRFRWQELHEKHGTLRVWEDEGEHARLVMFTEDETAKTYVLVDQATPEAE